MLWLVCCCSWAAISLAPNGRLDLAPAGVLVLVGTNPGVTPPVTGGWVNATMTSNTAPSPNAVTSTSSTGDPWKVFDHDTGTLSQFDGNAPGTPGVVFDFGEGVDEIVDRIKFTASAGYAPQAFSFSGRSSGAWVELAAGTMANTAPEQEFVATNSTAYRFYRLEWSSQYDAGSQVIIAEVKLWKD
jgi:hypothetical protein